MTFYYLRLAVRSILRTPLLSAVAVLGIGVGVAVPTVLVSLHHLFSKNPIPGKSDVLFNVRVDSWTPDSQFFDVRPGDPPKHITYRDMAGLMESDIPLHETGVASAVIFVFPDSDTLKPYQATVRLCHSDFFSMFDAPFRYGAAWSREGDARPGRVAVLSAETNEKLFGGENSVGRTFRLGSQPFTVIGVLDSWRPTPQFYDVINNAFGRPRDVFVPFDTIRDQAVGLSRTGDSDSWGDYDRSDPDAFFDASEVTWIQYWVELAPGDVAAYRQWVDGYAMAQKDLGRFPKPLNNRVTPLMEWLEVRQVAPPQSRAMVVISVLFLVVCCLNLTGLLLGRFLARAGHMGVHRAMGASRASIFAQKLVESELVGVLGGTAGIGLAAGTVSLLNRFVPSYMLPADVFGVDAFMLVTAVALALVAGLMSGVYPAWRACRIVPAMQLKVQ